MALLFPSLPIGQNGIMSPSLSQSAIKQSLTSVFSSTKLLNVKVNDYPNKSWVLNKGRKERTLGQQ
jgi:hypothetical protein